MMDREIIAWTIEVLRVLFTHKQRINQDMNVIETNECKTTIQTDLFIVKNWNYGKAWLSSPLALLNL